MSVIQHASTSFEMQVCRDVSEAFEKHPTLPEGTQWCFNVSDCTISISESRESFEMSVSRDVGESDVSESRCK